MMNQTSQIPSLSHGSLTFAGTVLEFGVAMGLSLALFLGAKRIPEFEPLIAIFPEQQRKLLIPISSILIGVVAIVVQFFAAEVGARRSIGKSFVALALLVVAGVLALLILYSGFVNVWDNPEYVVITGWSRLPGCACPSGNVRACIEGLAFVDLGSCWSDESIWGVKISLFLSYLVSIEGFAGLAGLYTLQLQEQERRRKEEQLKNADKSGAASQNTDFDDD